MEYPVIYSERGVETAKPFAKADLIEKAADYLVELLKAYTSGDANLPTIPVRPELVDIFKPPSVARAVFRVITMPGETLQFYIKSDVANIRTGAEGAAATETKTTWGAPVTVTPKLLYGYARFTASALERTEGVIDLVAEHLKDLSWDLGRKEDRNAFYGAGNDSNAENVWTGLNSISGTTVVDVAKAALAFNHINAAVAYFDALGAADNLVLVAHPRVLAHLRAGIVGSTSAGLMAVAGRVFESGEIISLLGLRRIVSAPNLPTRAYSGSDTTPVGDAFIFNPEYCIIADRRKPTIVRQLAPFAETADIAWDVKLVLRAGFVVTRPAAVYIIKNCLAQ